MSIDTGIPTDVMVSMQEAAERAAKGIRDLEEMRDAFAEMDRLRESLRKRVGILDVTAELIRDARNR